MKHIASNVNQTGVEHGDYSLLVLIAFSDERLEQLRKLRTLVGTLDKQTKELGQSFGYLTLWTSDANWLQVYESGEEVTEKIYDAVCASEYGFVEIPVDVYEERIRAHSGDDDMQSLRLRTELDYKVIDERGIYFTVAEDNTAANFESQFIAWWQLFDEDKPKGVTHEEATHRTPSDSMLRRG